MAEPQPSSSVDTLLGARPRSRARRWISIGLLLLALIAAGVLLLRFVEGNNTPYYMVPVTRASLQPHVTLQGTLSPYGEITVQAPSDAMVSALPNAVGTQLAQGEAVAVLDTSELARAIALDRSRLAAAGQQLQRARIGQRSASERLARFEKVWRESSGRVPSWNEMQQARADAARALLESRRDAILLDLARQGLDADMQRLDAMLPRAPMAGVVSEERIAPGTWVHAGQPILRMAPKGAGSLVTVPLDPSLGALAPDTPALVSVDGAQAREYSAMLLRVDTDSASRRRAVFALPPEPGVPLHARVRVSVTLPERRHVLLVPNAALAFAPQCSAQLGRSSICVLGRDGSARSVDIVAGPSDGRHTQVLAGALRPGELAIIGWRDVPPGSTPNPKP
ncbi:efflux RND transporter periplasmic adaptor subunit [Thiomonas sp. FB-6]|uniref:efflux RND transporter periplasmic adaptor subunit n=1 Tax=Thiomonas sp. FB-6 TaxID=1158291 RepID=UPI00035FF12D|nr:HlyD family efflux transporter periplasmic adaptor subunit [Thiomonas sp. FB-6]